jgi:hypothetical protein
MPSDLSSRGMLPWHKNKNGVLSKNLQNRFCALLVQTGQQLQQKSNADETVTSFNFTVLKVRGFFRIGVNAVVLFLRNPNLITIQKVLCHTCKMMAFLISRKNPRQRT